MRRRSHVHIELATVLAVAIIGLLAMVGCRSTTIRPAGVTGTPGIPRARLVAPAAAGVVAPPAAGAYIGVYRPPAPFDATALDAYASISPKKPAIVMWYQPWAETGRNKFDAAACVSLYQRGAIPLLTWEPWDPGKDAGSVKDGSRQTAWRLANIISGQYDAYIREFAVGVKSVRGPVMIRLMHEMNGDWYPWDGSVNGNSPQQFVQAWRHVHDIFAKEGVTNATWVWSINHESVPDTPANAFAAYYPGDAYVDWVSMSGFNWGTSSAGTRWRTFDYWFDKPLAYLATLGKPVVLAEFGSVDNGGDKGAWILDAYAKVAAQHPQVKAVVYYDKLERLPTSQQDWRIESSARSLAGYRTAVASDYFLSAPPATLASWTASLTLDGWAYLRSLKPIY